MKGIIKFLKRILGKYDVGYEYWVNLKDIKIPTYFKLTRVGTKKWNHKMSYWVKNW